MDRIAEEGFNLNISRYISTAVGEEEIDLSFIQGELVQIEKQIRNATSKHNVFLKELGLALLPGDE
jgi:type I restriction enzyme M protein